MDELDTEKAVEFINRVPLSKINRFGLYGGEISIDYPLYQKFIDILPKGRKRFTITNGSWSLSKKRTIVFINFIARNSIWAKVSSTPEHIKYQNRRVLLRLQEFLPHRIYIKEVDDTEHRLLPMGRLSDLPFSCTMKCIRAKDPYRIAMRPDGKVIFQSCDGVYPIVGCWKDSLSDIELEVKRIINKVI